MSSVLLFVVGVVSGQVPGSAPDRHLQTVQIASTADRFVLVPSGRPFVPWGFNCGGTDALIEEYWEKDWARVERDFREMKSLGATVARVHLQFGRFMEAADRPNRAALDRLGRLLQSAEAIGLYVDITGLACYRPADVPAWYDALSEPQRWAAQARFWEAVAGVGKSSPAVFCYDLMNEPIVPGEKRQPGQWRSGQLLGGFDFVQFITLDPAGRPREEIASSWIRQLVRAIRSQDPQHPITVGLLPWRPDWGHLSGFLPARVARELDFISVHIYPEAGKVDEALKCLRQFAVGKPLVIEETFPLACTAAELRDFMLRSRGTACGWIGHYAGETIQQLEAIRDAKKLTIGQALWLEELKLFRDLRPVMLNPPATAPASQPAN